MSNRNDTFYLAFKDTKPSWSLIGSALLLGTIATIGIIFHFCVIFVTIRSKSLRGTSNYLLALCSLYELFHQLGHFMFVYIALSGRNFIEYRFAAKFVFLSIFGIGAIFPTMFFTGMDRLIAVLNAETHDKIKKRPYLAVITVIAVLFGAIPCFDLFMGIDLFGDQMVTGCLNDFLKVIFPDSKPRTRIRTKVAFNFSPDYTGKGPGFKDAWLQLIFHGEFLVRIIYLHEGIELFGDHMVTGYLLDYFKARDFASMYMVYNIFIVMTGITYVIVGVVIRIKSSGLPSSASINEHTFRSLSCIIFVIIGGYLIFLFYLLLINPSISSPITAWFGSVITAIPLNIGSASNGPILYFTSTDYRKAFHTEFQFVFKRFSNANRTAPQQNVPIRLSTTKFS